MLVTEVAEAQEDTGREEEDEEIEIHEECGPSGRLVLGDGGDDGDVPEVCGWKEDEGKNGEGSSLFGVACVPEGVEPTSPGSNPTFVCQNCKSKRSENPNDNDTGV